MTKLRLGFIFSLALSAALAGQTRGNPSQIRVRVDANGSLLASSAVQVSPVTTVQFTSANLAVDSSGNLIVVCTSCGTNITGGTCTGSVVTAIAATTGIPTCTASPTLTALHLGTGVSLTFGGTTSSFPAFKRSTTEIQARLADDSDYADLHGQTVTANAAFNIQNGGKWSVSTSKVETHLLYAFNASDFAMDDVSLSRQAAGIIQIGDGAANANGTIDAGAYVVGATAGASCTLTVVAHLTVVNGIVTLCN